MSAIGCLGDVAFEVHDGRALTPKNMVWGGRARHGVHPVHGTHAVTEFCGLEPDTMAFDLVLSTDLGVSPMDELGKLWGYQRTGTAVPLVIGGKAYGKYRWNVQTLTIKLERTDALGVITWATVSVELLEYFRDWVTQAATPTVKITDAQNLYLV